MARTLKEIMDSGARKGSGPDFVVYAGYMAGREEMRAEIAGDLTATKREYRAGRYHRVEQRAQDHLLSHPALGGQGRTDAPEMLSWEF